MYNEINITFPLRIYHVLGGLSRFGRSITFWAIYHVLGDLSPQQRFAARRIFAAPRLGCSAAGLLRGWAALHLGPPPKSWASKMASPSAFSEQDEDLDGALEEGSSSPSGCPSDDDVETSQEVVASIDPPVAKGSVSSSAAGGDGDEGATSGAAVAAAGGRIRLRILRSCSSDGGGRGRLRIFCSRRRRRQG